MVIYKLYVPVCNINVISVVKFCLYSGCQYYLMRCKNLVIQFQKWQNFNQIWQIQKYEKYWNKIKLWKITKIKEEQQIYF